MVSAEKSRSQTIVKPMSYLVDLPVFVARTQSQPEKEQISYEELDGVTRPCVSWPEFKLLETSWFRLLVGNQKNPSIFHPLSM